MIERKSKDNNNNIMDPEYPTYSPSKSMKCSYTSSPRSSPVLKKTLRFSDTSVLIVTKPRSDSDRQASWYTKHEIRHFRKTAEQAAKRFANSQESNVIKHVAYSVMSGAAQSDKSFHHKELVCGLEHMISPSILKVLIQRRKMTIERVLEEQHVQTELGENDPIRIALASMENSAFTKEWRRRIACLHMSDAREVAVINREPVVHTC